MTTLLKVCAWHEGKQLILSPVIPTHGICPVCRARLYAQMKRPGPQWVQLIADGGWQHVADGSYFGRLLLDFGPELQNRYEILHVGQPVPYRLVLNGKPLYEGSLDECLERAIQF